MYYCRDCDNYFAELDDKEVCLEEEYGVSFPTKTYTRVDCCPYCSSTDFDEEYDDEIADLLNFLRKDNKVVKSLNKINKKYLKILDALKDNIYFKIYDNKLYVAETQIDVTEELKEWLNE